MKKVTAWSTYNPKENVWEHNHLDESGWVEENVPTLKFECQKSNWANKEWKKEYCYYDEKAGTIIEDME